jgi:hypothetical protein
MDYSDDDGAWKWGEAGSSATVQINIDQWNCEDSNSQDHAEVQHLG